MNGSENNVKRLPWHGVAAAKCKDVCIVETNKQYEKLFRYVRWMERFTHLVWWHGMNGSEYERELV